MKYLKLFESYYEDLTPYTYSRKEGRVNVGWLDSSKDYTKGKVDDNIIQKLKLIEPSERYKGFHRCPFCNDARGSTNYEVRGNGKIYCYPELLIHYIEKHDYKPPQEFIDVIDKLDIPKKDREVSRRRMKGISETNQIRNPYIGKSYRKPEFIGDIKEPVEIRIDVEAVSHALDRQFRHGFSSNDNDKIGANISKDEILDDIQSSIEQLTISLMQDEFNINQEENDYPTKGVKAGEPNRFVIRNKKTNLNIVCQLEAGENEFKLTVITVMRKPDFREYNGQYVVEV
jgi:hypothetical protein